MKKETLVLLLRYIDRCAALNLRMHSYLLFRTNLKCDLICERKQLSG